MVAVAAVWYVHVRKSVHSLAKEGKVTSKKVRNKEERFEERPFTYLELLNNAKVKVTTSLKNHLKSEVTDDQKELTTTTNARCSRSRR